MGHLWTGNGDSPLACGVGSPHANGESRMAHYWISMSAGTMWKSAGGVSSRRWRTK